MRTFSNKSCNLAAQMLYAVVYDKTSPLSEIQRQIIVDTLDELYDTGESVNMPKWIWESDMSDWDVSITRNSNGSFNFHYEAKSSFLKGNEFLSGDLVLPGKPEDDDHKLAFIKAENMVSTTSWSSNIVAKLRQQFKDEGLL